ncbi:MAG TPA: 23S rRNA (adenine(2503)-C(2))-methyltransferase RlmN [Chitinophagales bacterium]|nr:23S rRNA (adenine(2503)-C(2))-methyltransferase RlmN [Chitinophagales bacterium]
MQAKPDIREFPPVQLEEYLIQKKEKPFRVKQIQEWLWKKSVRSFDEMTNLSLPLRKMLTEDFVINSLKEDFIQKSADGTIKMRFRLYDENLIEGVLIPSIGRITACLSSQAGCSLDCHFCATGFMQLKRNLFAGEIYDQVVLLNRISVEAYGKPLTNIVFMGMGEPLLNYKNVLAAIDKITSENGLNISAKRITVSTSGIAKMIKKLGDDGARFELALSLHSANNMKRSKIMPINGSNPIENLAEALNYFHQKTGNKITFEYILFDGFNDSLEDARELVELCRKVPVSMVNIIEYNPVEAVPYKKSPEKKREVFVNYLERHGVIAKVRHSRGKDIDAACGQLAIKERNGTVK